MRAPDRPGLRFSTVFAAALALSIGWGIRGNFGHEFGAMIPGALAAIVVCLMSGREDWRRRVVYFAFFGALGWGFGGSMSYGQVIGYTHSGQYSTMVYGFAMLFIIGYIWGGMGGAGTAFPAVVDRERMQQVFAPFVWIVVTWWLWEFFGRAMIAEWATEADSSWQRHLDPLYWFDTDWVLALLTLIAIGGYALFHEPLKRLVPPVQFGAVYGFIAFFLQFYLGFHAFWFVPVAAIVGALVGGLLRDHYDEALGLAVIIGAFSALGLLIGDTLELGFDHWFVEGGVVVAVVVFALWFHRSNMGAFAIAIPVAAALTFVSLRVWNVEDIAPVDVLWIVVLFSVFAGMLALPPSRFHGFAVCAAIGGFIGAAVQRIGGALGMGNAIARGADNILARFGTSGPFPRRLGDLTLVERAAAGEELTEAQAQLAANYAGDSQAYLDDLFTNWPTFFGFEGVLGWLGWALGLIAGAAFFFRRYGRFDFGARLYTYMAVGWFIGFLLFPVLLGIRMTPPRSDSWAGTLGLFAGTLVFLFRAGLAPAVYASLVSAIVGGVGFSGAVFLKLMMARIGNPLVVDDPDVIERFAHYQSSNWHSFMEQSYGFINGIGIAVAMALLAQTVRPTMKTGTRSGWTGAFAAGFVLLFIVFVNWRKAVGTWIDHGAVSESLKMFWFAPVEFSTQQWFAIVYWMVGGVAILLLARNVQQPLAVLPGTWLGRGQLLFLVFLWITVIFNFERALTAFSQGRLITEAMITVNAAVVTLILLAFTQERDPHAIAPRRTREVPYVGAIVLAIALLLCLPVIQTNLTRVAYRGIEADTALLGGRTQYRFGPDAQWRIRPLLKSEEHR